MINRIDQEFSFNQTALNPRVYRQELLVSDLFNAAAANFAPCNIRPAQKQ
ncbi:MAG: hypothetical protein WC073_14535 [Sterolibacterium sp.]